MPYLPTVVHQHRERAEAEDPESSEQFAQTLHPEGTGILKGQGCREPFSRGGCTQRPQRWEVKK